jgi:hypothetical protein
MSRSIVLFTQQQDYYEDFLMEGIIEDIKNKFRDIKFFNRFDQNIKNKQKLVQTKLKQHEEQLQKVNINVKKIKEIILSKTPTIVKRLQNAKTIEEGSEILSDGFKEIFGITKEHVFLIDKVEMVLRGVVLSLALVILIVYINTIVALFFIAKTGSATIGFAIMALFSAPLVEETGKYLAIKYGATGQFWIAFNAAEFILYMRQAVMMGLPLIAMAIGRLIVVMMHTVTMYIMYKMRKEDQRISDTEASSSRLSLIIGMIIHFFWNLGPTLLTFKL